MNLQWPGFICQADRQTTISRGVGTKSYRLCYSGEGSGKRYEPRGTYRYQPSLRGSTLRNFNRHREEPVEQLNRETTKNVTVDLTVDELKSLLALASDQLFRREFIDPKMPGYKHDTKEISVCKAVVARLQALVAGPRKTLPARGA